MRYKIIILLAFTPASLATAGDGLPFEILDRVKDATVFVKAGGGSYQRTGTGFLINVDGTSGLIATNEHVIAALSPNNVARKKITVVFHSGQQRENIVPGNIVAVDKEKDLAIVRVRGVKNLPKPLRLHGTVALRETMSVYAVGFPLGAELSVTKGNPSVSFNKGSVSSLRKDERGELVQIQIEGCLHAGNSGGPIVDARGRLVGIAVARVSGTDLGISIPSKVLAEMLKGQPKKVELRVRKVAKGFAEVDVSLRLIDPLNKINSISIRVARNDSLTEFTKDKDGNWPPLQRAKTVDLKITDQVARGTILLKSKKDSVAYFSFQPVFTSSGEDRTCGRPSRPFRIDFRNNKEGNLPTLPFRSKVIEITPKAPKSWIFKEARKGAPIFSDSEYVLAGLPKDILGGTLLVRMSAEQNRWLKPFAIEAVKNGTVFAIVRWKRFGKEEVSELTLAKLKREGWEELKGAIATTFPDGEDWRWIALRKRIEKGKVVLQLRTVRWPNSPVLFVFKKGK